MTQQLKLAELLCTRLCHDLTGPVGAIANGMEFLQEDDKMQEQATDLIASSAAQAVARLQFYRKTYGRINENGEANLDELRLVARNFFGEGKIKLDWPDMYADAAGVALSYRMGRLLFNLLLIASATLLRGGTLAVVITGTGSSKEIALKASGKSLKWEKETGEVLSGNVSFESLTPKNIQIYLTHLLAKELDARIVCHADADAVEIKAIRTR